MIKAWGLQDFFILIAFLSLSAIKLDSFAGDPGLGWHLRSGEYLWQNFSFPNTDPFLFSSTDKFWIVDQWLGDLLLYLGEAKLGWPVTYWLGTSFFVLCFAVIPYQLTSRKGVPALISSLAIIIPFQFAQIHFLYRPVLFSFGLFLLTYLFLSKIKLDQKIKLTELLTLLAIFIVWANLHPSFILGFFLIVFLTLSQLIDSNFTKATTPKIISRGALFGLIAVLGTLCNPYTVQIYQIIFNVAFSPYIKDFFLEWYAPSFGDTALNFLLWPFLAVLIARLIEPQFFKKLGWYYLFVFIGMFYFAATAYRFYPYYAVVAFLPSALAFQVILFRLAKLKFKTIQTFAVHFSNLEKREQQTNQGLVVFYFSVILGLAYTLTFNAVPLYQGEYGLSKINFPYQALKAIEGHWIDQTRPARVLNDFNWGGYITGLYGGRKIQAFVDDRTGLHGEEFFKTYDQLFTTKYFIQYAKNVKADYVLVQNKQKNKDLIQKIRSNYRNKLIYVDELSLVLQVK